MSSPPDRSPDRSDLQELALRAAAGSRQDLQELLSEIHSRRLAYPGARRVLADPADVDDAVQETLIAVARGIGTFQARARFTTWLHRIAYHAALEVLRRKTRVGTPSEDVPEPAGTLRRMSSVAATRMDVENALRRLPAEYQEALRLREWDQQSYEEIAERLNLPIGTVRSRISRARRLVAVYLNLIPK
ncbi:RNA polymerase sigma-70 factor (ECF subfamily) [Actinoplanes lutulentus]|uniref:RNA polymerase sigma-70 factor (ECF subfamily) n=1 Tax=Actinoplanes lutulentus TaxID=1287878 RepID=A0A327Z1C5_9ACTN|nr:RNA polymerase sigma factor [Actinoplanes lutulentus]MBB2947465.1 RNA polymerase sigma-70 factor (ECF subfamily) [Actinoplanes lutulentus]RAK28072.1 RNA polymerase sigma-70 factor (ECF subfamily) [Actinoplanes lutulentus]